ncbi:MAG: hypothetical protein M3Q69_01400 [Acidobacteriota bacterium]|nr:hypothetical protein [Acidobacteriota bacterium]
MSAAPSLYSAFALTIASEVPLLDLLPGSGEPDVHVSIGATAPPESFTNAWTVFASPRETTGTAPAAGRFVVRNGREIVIEPYPDADPRALRLAIVGPLLGVILTQRGAFVLHASTVSIDGHAVALAGPSGRGKSTLAATLARAGHPLIADDITVIAFPNGKPTVQPGFPRVKLWPDSAAALAEDADALPLLHPNLTKRSMQLDRFAMEPVPLARCYLLEDGETDAIDTPSSASETMLALVRYTYQASWMHENGAAGTNLLHCGSLARSGVVRRLRRRRTFDALAAVVGLIEADVAR